MRTTSPTFVGFESLFDRAFGASKLSRDSMFDSSYPKYNIRKISEDEYEIQLALSGFSKNELAVTFLDGHTLKVSGKKENETVNNFLYQGISYKSFTREFDIDSNLEVNDVSYVDGLLSIKLIKHQKSDNIKMIEIN